MQGKKLPIIEILISEQINIDKELFKIVNSNSNISLIVDTKTYNDKNSLTELFRYNYEL